MTREKSLPADERDRMMIGVRYAQDAPAMARRRDSDRLSSASLQRGAFCLIAGDARRHQFVIQRGWPLPPKGPIFARDVLNSWESSHADGQDDTALRRIARFRYRYRRLPPPASQCRASEQEAGLVSVPARRVEYERPTGEGTGDTGAQRRLLGMLHQDGCADPDPFIRSQILRDASGFFG